jgi:HD-like signal output (HDOD) protein
MSHAKHPITEDNTLPEPVPKNSTRHVAISPGIPVRKRIGELLIDAKLITLVQLEEALKAQTSRPDKVVDILISLGYLTHEAFVRFLASQPGMASIDLLNYEVPTKLISMIPREFVIKHEVFPIDTMGKLLTLGMVCPLDSKTIQELETITGLRVKPLLCSPQAVRQCIHRYYPDAKVLRSIADVGNDANLVRLLGPMKLKSLIILIREINSLPALPETVKLVREAMVNPLSTIADIGNIISMDPAIAAKVLSVANSDTYGFCCNVDNVTHAVTLLGLRETNSIILSAAVVDFLEHSRVMDYRSFWRGAMLSSAASKIVAKACHQDGLSGVFMAALLHDIGRVALAEVLGDRYAQISPNKFGKDLIAEEERLFGFAHPEAGYELVTHWNLPDSIAQSCRFHHNPELANPMQRNVVNIVAVASAMAYSADDSDDAKQRFLEVAKIPLAALNLDWVSGEAIFEVFMANRDTFLGVAATEPSRVA